MKYPFYHDYMAGRTNASTGPNDKIAIQLSLIANHLVKHGDLSFLKTLWDSVGTVVHRQACFMDFNWTSRHLVNLFHHIFVVGLEDIGTSILNEGSYSLEFCCRGPFQYLSVRFWKGETLCKVELARFGRATTFPAGDITMISKLLSSISNIPNIVCCSGCPKDLIALLDGCNFVEHGLQYPFRFDEFSFSSLLHKRKGSVFGPIDFCSVLRFLIVRLEPALKYLLAR